MKVINLAEAHAAMLRQVQAKGADYVYKPPFGGSYPDPVTCVNWFWDDANRARVPSCIVGHALEEWGVLGKVPQSLSADDVGAHTEDVLAFTDAAKFFLVHVQASQDNGVPWGEAVDASWKQIQQDIDNGFFDRATETWLEDSDA